MTTTVTVLNGVDTIGGNVVSFETEQARVIMDFGMNFAPADTRPDDLLASGVLPNLPDLFSDEKRLSRKRRFSCHTFIWITWGRCNI